MAGDYAREGAAPAQDQAQAFAERREIRFPERAREIVEKVRDKARGMFVRVPAEGGDVTRQSDVARARRG